MVPLYLSSHGTPIENSDQNIASYYVTTKFRLGSETQEHRQQALNYVPHHCRCSSSVLNVDAQFCGASLSLLNNALVLGSPDLI